MKWPPVIHTMPVIAGTSVKIPASRKELAFVHLCDMKLNDHYRKQNSYSDQEIDKRKDRNFGVGALLFRPFFRFIRAYIFKGGFRDGLPGLVFAYTESLYQVMFVTKIIEKKVRKGLPLNSLR